MDDIHLWSIKDSNNNINQPQEMKPDKSNPTYETREVLMLVVKDPNTVHKRLVPIHAVYYQHEIDKLDTGSQVSAVFTTKKRQRTKSQNSYLHLYFTLIAISHGHGVTMEEVKSWAKGKCLSNGITEIYGDKVRKVKDTSKLTIGEMIEFVARVEVESGIPAPDPTPFKFGPSHEEWDRLKQEQIVKYISIRSNFTLC